LKEYYFEINQTENSDGTIRRDTFTFPEFFRPDLGSQGIINTFDDVQTDNTYGTQINLFDRNQIWQLIKDVFATDLKFKALSKGQVIAKINEFLVSNLITVLDAKDNSLPIKKLNSSEQTEYINLKVIDNDRNVAIWKVSNTPILTLINRYRAPYIPYFQLIEDNIKFQLPKYQINNTLFNIYDENFGGEGISATGLWEEVQGNIVSSLFCKENNIELTIPFTLDVDYKKLLIQSLDFNDTIITNKNSAYISKINANVDEYILEQYATTLLLNFYQFSYVQNELKQKMNYTADIKNPYLLHFKDSSKYSQAFNKLTFVFVRK